jgi:hypothetical protein
MMLSFLIRSSSKGSSLGRNPGALVLVIAMGFAFYPIAVGGRQVQRNPVFQLPGSTAPGTLEDPNGDNDVDAERLLNVLNAERLVNNLNGEIERNDPGVLSSNQLRKVAEIEKLAHTIKDKMSYSVRGTAPYRPPPPLLKR